MSKSAFNVSVETLVGMQNITVGDMKKMIYSENSSNWDKKQLEKENKYKRDVER